MNAVLNKISSIILAMLVLFSTFSFTVEKHFCGDNLVAISFFGDSVDCADEIGEEDCDDPKKVAEDNCCKDEIQQIKGQEDLRVSFEKFDLKKHYFSIAFFLSQHFLFSEEYKQDQQFLSYVEPFIPKNFQALHEVFLI
jgi:hypothetical protein